MLVFHTLIQDFITSLKKSIYNIFWVTQIYHCLKNYNSHFRNDTSDLIVNNLPSKQKELFDLIGEGKSERYVAKKLYNSIPSSQNYQQLQKRLFPKLIDVVNTIKGVDNYDRIRFKLWKQMLSVRIYRNLGLRSAAIDLALKSFKTAYKYKLWYDLIYLSRTLAIHYTLYDVDNEKSSYYKKIGLKAHRLNRLETEIELQRAKILRVINDKRTSSITLLKKELATLAGKMEIESPRAEMNYFMALLELYKFDQDHVKFEKTLKEAYNFNHHLDFGSSTFLSMLNYSKAEYLIKVGRLNESEHYLKDLISKSDKKRTYYDTYIEFYFKCLMLNEKFLSAKEELLFMIKLEKKKKFKIRQDRIEVYKVFSDLSLYKEPNIKKAKRAISGPLDKLYIQIPLKVAEVCITYNQTNDKFIDQIESLKQYMSKNLKDLPRTKQFFYALIQTAQGQKVDPQSLKGLPAEEEIIAYDKLYEIVTRT